MVSINPIDRWPSSRITVKMLTGPPWSVVCSRAAVYVCRNEWRVTALSIRDAGSAGVQQRENGMQQRE